MSMLGKQAERNSGDETKALGCLLFSALLANKRVALDPGPVAVWNEAEGLRSGWGQLSRVLAMSELNLSNAGLALCILRSRHGCE